MSRPACTATSDCHGGARATFRAGLLGRWALHRQRQPGR